MTNSIRLSSYEWLPAKYPGMKVSTKPDTIMLCYGEFPGVAEEMHKRGIENTRMTSYHFAWSASSGVFVQQVSLDSASRPIGGSAKEDCISIGLPGPVGKVMSHAVYEQLRILITTIAVFASGIQKIICRDVGVRFESRRSEYLTEKDFMDILLRI